MPERTVRSFSVTLLRTSVNAKFLALSMCQVITDVYQKLEALIQYKPFIICISGKNADYRPMVSLSFVKAVSYRSCVTGTSFYINEEAFPLTDHIIALSAWATNSKHLYLVQ